MDIDALRGFLAFVETGSFTRAAKQICRTQSAFSAQMKKLEEEVGQPLFEKEGRNLVLSEAGKLLNNHAQRLLSLHDESLQQLKGYQNKRSLRLGCPEDYNDAILPVIVNAISHQSPRLSIQIISEPSVELRRRLDEGDIDAAILTRAPDSDEGYWLCADQGVWIASADKKALQVSPLPLALFQTDCKYHGAAIDGLTKRGTAFQLISCSNTASAQRAIVRHGIAIGAMGRVSVSPDLVILENMPPLPAVDVVMAVSAASHPLLTKEFLQQLPSLFEAIPLKRVK
ncbi:LysR family transcriptional regulator [Thaumasiovibrio subtropicus]|uniref:LysR family transcriptional regulator n=1 Tax=Thaumasiovibrio subtropicus TaxID=1891207 RepID=UPI000B36426D|nr:LysR family transcriptional regulator [Thaumasiovibrio subtropicus]